MFSYFDCIGVRASIHIFLSLSYYFLRIFENEMEFSREAEIQISFEKNIKKMSTKLFKNLISRGWFWPVYLQRQWQNVLFRGALAFFSFYIFIPKWVHFSYNINIIEMPKTPCGVFLALISEFYISFLFDIFSCVIHDHFKFNKSKIEFLSFLSFKERMNHFLLIDTCLFTYNIPLLIIQLLY